MTSIAVKDVIFDEKIVLFFIHTPSCVKNRVCIKNSKFKKLNTCDSHKIDYGQTYVFKNAKSKRFWLTRFFTRSKSFFSKAWELLLLDNLFNFLGLKFFQWQRFDQSQHVAVWGYILRQLEPFGTCLYWKIQPFIPNHQSPWNAFVNFNNLKSHLHIPLSVMLLDHECSYFFSCIHRLCFRKKLTLDMS